MSAPKMLSGDAVSCIRGERKVFSNLNFSVSAGEALAVVGPNGSGKSSLLRLIAGLVAIASGTITLAGGDDNLTLAEQAHLLGHRDAIKPSLTVLENVAFWFDFLGGDGSQSSAGGGTRGRRLEPSRPLAHSFPVGRPAPAAGDRAPRRAQAPALAAGRADHRARRGRASD